MGSRSSSKSRSIEQPASPLASLALPAVLLAVLAAGIALIVFGLK